ncbi:hypothetical protein, partial [Nonomuraea sp. NPDC005501]|uniref:hypothetical protein n=1 Tax=Nonomuraea sp. NPDC005501 TaxID=3156884 RepID=UPI0033BECA77
MPASWTASRVRRNSARSRPAGASEEVVAEAGAGQTREPGSTKVGMRLRAILLDAAERGLSPRA